MNSNTLQDRISACAVATEVAHFRRKGFTISISKLGMKCGSSLVDLGRIELPTSSMPWKRAPSCATGPRLHYLISSTFQNKKSNGCQVSGRDPPLDPIHIFSFALGLVAKSRLAWRPALTSISAIDRIQRHIVRMWRNWQTR